ncbi:phosphodiester glycosidase family protein [Egicoccus sp. AB-alg6-2]|uniref:phosphodiester glycosidase family protein n=1 Tax=Egicoccus sp. AB-alg6-2 TaxID=3242692 RepID=UPI00359DFF2A
MLDTTVRARGGALLASTTRRASRSLVAVLLLALAATLLPTAPAHAALEVRTGNTQRVLGGLTHQQLDINLDGRRIRGQALRFRDASDLQLRPRLAGGTATGLQTMPQMIRSEYAKGAIAGVNGGYFIAQPNGNPNGLHVQDSRLVATHAIGLPSGNTQFRAALGIQQNGRIIGDKLNVGLLLSSPDLALTNVPVVDLNRIPVREGIHLYDRYYGRAFPIPANHTAVLVTDLPLGTSGTAEGTVISQRAAGGTATTHTLAAGETAIVVSANNPLATAPRGTRVAVTANVAPITAGPASDWTNLRGAIAGAGLLVKNGSVQSGASHNDQGINHATSRRARTAVGRLDDGRSLLVTVDETSVGSGDGVTLHEMGRIMAALGVVDAVAIDGGGSTTMAVNGSVVNRPSDRDRGHSSALFVYAPLPPASRAITGACPSGRVPSGGFRDTAGNTHAASIDCLAWWNVTQGTEPGVFSPNGTVTRQQMASFLARWLDDIAARGNGTALPASAPNNFTDVGTGTTHEASISRLAAARVISGTSTTTFNPTGSVTRAQTASMLARALNYARGAELPAARDTFIDDNHIEAHEANIDRLAHQGVIGGTGGYNYGPDQPVTRGAMASLIMRGSDLLVSENRVAPPS